MKKLEFTVKILSREIGAVAALAPPFNVVEVFGTRARVPVRGTINGYPFRSSLMPMADCLQGKGTASVRSSSHMMPVCKALRDGAGVKPGDTVNVVMERDEDKRIVEVPAVLKKELPRAKLLKPIGRNSRSRIRKRSLFRSREPNRKRRARGVWRKPWAS